MKLLVDTHVLVWWLSDAGELSSRARELLASPENLAFVSAATIWELRIKEAIGKIQLPDRFAEVLDAQPFEQLSITAAHAHAVRDLPLHHRDPFDRILIAQARVEDLTLLTHDPIASRYDVRCELV